jgi:hypothetical protein
MHFKSAPATASEQQRTPLSSRWNPRERWFPDSVRAFHPRERVAGAAIAVPGGAFTGWAAFSLSLGLLSADHGSAFRRSRMIAVQAGAIDGPVIGLRCGWPVESLA